MVLSLPKRQQDSILPANTSSNGVLSISSSHGVSRDEMNLAEFPLTVLSTRSDPKVKTLEFRDTQRLKNGELIEREWIITGADKFGLPTSTDDDVVLGLIRLTMDQGFRDRKVYFTRYELLQILRWSSEGRSYSRLTRSLDRLSGVRIRSTNAFYDNSSKGYQTCNFGIIDAYEINDERAKNRGVRGRSTNGNGDGDSQTYSAPNRARQRSRIGYGRVAEHGRLEVGVGGSQPNSYFIWSEMLFDSFRAGFIKKLDMELYFSLKSAVSRRLYRYLDKHFYYRSVVEKPLVMFAFEKLGLSRNYRFVSQIRQQIEPGAEELKRAGFISNYEFVGRGEGTVVRFFAHAAATDQLCKVVGVSVGEGRADVVKSGEIQTVPMAKAISATAAKARPAAGKEIRPPLLPAKAHSAGGSDLNGDHGNSDHGNPANGAARVRAAATVGDHVRNSVSEALKTALVESLISRGLTLAQARNLLAKRQQSELEQVERIVRYYDHLVETQDPRISRNRIGFLYRAVENPDRFVIPVAFQARGSTGLTTEVGVGGRTGAASEGGVYDGAMRGRAQHALRPERKIFTAADAA